jgi:putative endonuclease
MEDEAPIIKLLRATVDAVHQFGSLAYLLSMWFVYLIKCSNGSIYTGCTTDINRRLVEHNAQKVYFTKDKTPVVLLSYFAFTEKYRAFNFELYLKSGSGIAFRNRHLI